MLNHEQALAMLKQKRLLAIERRATADEEVRVLNAQIDGYQAAVDVQAGLAPREAEAADDAAADATDDAP